MKSIIFLFLLLIVTIFAFIKQDQVIDTLLGTSESTQVEVKDEIENVSENEVEGEDTQDDISTPTVESKLQEAQISDELEKNRDLDADFELVGDTEEESEGVSENENEVEGEGESIATSEVPTNVQDILDNKKFTSENLSFTYSPEFSYAEKTANLIEIYKEDTLIGNIQVVTLDTDESLESFFSKSDLDILSLAASQGVYPVEFSQSFVDKALKLERFLGLEYLNYYILKDGLRIIICNIESSYDNDAFAKVTISSINPK